MKKSVVIGLFVMLLVAGLVGTSVAAIYEVSPTVKGATYTGSTGIYHGTATVGYWWAPAGYYRYWEKFDIPTLAPGETISEVLINVDAKSQYNKTYNAGVYVYRVSDDSWTSATIYSDWALAGEYVANRYASDAGGTPLGLISSDITSWLSLPGEGEGQTLSVSLRHAGGGARGVLLTSAPTLTITTVPEPMTMLLLGLGSLAMYRRRK